MRGSAMQLRNPFTRSPRRFAWLLWLALLLPIAQAASVQHALSHTGQDAGIDTSGKQAPHASHCDLCLTAAGLDGSALPSEAPTLLHAVARHALPQVALSGAWIASPLRAYRSRAPPLAPR
jgi:hypothetical protein